MELRVPDEDYVRPSLRWRQAMMAHILSGQSDVDHVIATALCVSANDIPDPRERGGPWRPGWRPFG